MLHPIGFLRIFLFLWVAGVIWFLIDFYRVLDWANLSDCWVMLNCYLRQLIMILMWHLLLSVTCVVLGQCNTSNRSFIFSFSKTCNQPCSEIMTWNLYVEHQRQRPWATVILTIPANLKIGTGGKHLIVIPPIDTRQDSFRSAGAWQITCF